MRALQYAHARCVPLTELGWAHCKETRLGALQPCIVSKRVLFHDRTWLGTLHRDSLRHTTTWNAYPPLVCWRPWRAHALGVHAPLAYPEPPSPHALRLDSTLIPRWCRLCASRGARFVGLQARPWMVSRNRLQTYKAKFTEQLFLLCPLSISAHRVGLDLQVILAVTRLTVYRWFQIEWLYCLLSTLFAIC